MFFLGLVSSTTLYSALALLLCVFGFDVDWTTIGEAASDPSGFLDWFYAIGVWSVAVYPLSRITAFAIGRIRWRSHRSPWHFYVFEVTWANVTNPFRGLVATMGTRQYMDPSGFYRRLSFFTQYLHLVWSVCLWAWLALGLTLTYTR